MDFQRKIFAHLLVFISTGLFLSILVDADDFSEDRQCLGECFAGYFKKMKGWCENNLWESDPIQDYKNALEANVSRFIRRMGKKVKNIEKFVNTTKLYFTAIENQVVKFENEPDEKIEAIIDLCKEIKKNCSSNYHPPNIPLIDHLKSLFEKSKEHVQKGAHNESEFAEHCQPASASHDVYPDELSSTPIKEE